MFRTFHGHHFRLSSWACARLTTIYALLVSTGVLADIVNIPTGPFEGQVVLTNLVFADWDEYYSYKQNMLSVLSQMEDMHDLCTNRLAKIQIDITHAGSNLFQAQVKISLWGSSESAYATGNELVREAREYVRSADSELVSASRSCSDMRASLSDVDNELKTVRQAIESDATEYHGTFAISASDDSSSGGCQCPDYTQILNYIDSKLGTLVTNVQNINSYVQQLFTTIDRELFEFLDDWFNLWDGTYYYQIALAGQYFSSVFGRSTTDDNWGPDFGSLFGNVAKTNVLALGRVLSELLALHDVTGNYWLNKTATADSNISQFVYDVFNPLRQLFANDVTDATSYSQYYPAVAQMLNFLWTRNVHPTNAFTNPLYVTNTSPMTLEITPDSAGSVEHPINVSVGNPDVVVNMDGVTVTNKLALVVTTQDSDPLNVNVVNFDDLTDILDQYFKNGSSVDNAETDQEEENDESEEELDDDINADGRDPQFYLSVDSFHTALTKYRQMLVSIDQLIPDSANPPRFYFDYSFKFSSAGSDPSSDSESIQVMPIGPDPDDVSHMGRVLSVFRSFCSVIWLGVVLVTALWLVKWSLFGLSYATAISMTIASGDLSALAKLLPGFIKDLLSAGDA